MKWKQLLGMVLAGTVFLGGIVSAAELDFAWYGKNNPDVVAALGDSPEMLKLHYEMFGRKEGRMANANDVEAQLRRLFNAAEYARLNPDVKAAIGEDAEVLFQHYMAFGLLEGRRPSEKVSKDVAISIKKEVEKAMKKAGLDATPGSLHLVAAITGMVRTDIGQTAVQQALWQALITATTPQKEEEKSGKSGYSIKEDAEEGGYYIKVYNANGQLIETQYYRDGELNDIMKYEYNEQGQKIKGNYYTPEGEFYGFSQYTYDAQGRISGSVYYNSAGKEQDRTDYTYDENGLRIGKNYNYRYTTGDGGQESREEVLSGESKYDPSTEKWISGVKYEYDSSGKKVSEATYEYKSDGSAIGVRTSYREDGFTEITPIEISANGWIYTKGNEAKYYNKDGVEITMSEYYGRPSSSPEQSMQPNPGQTTQPNPGQTTQPNPGQTTQPNPEQTTQPNQNQQQPTGEQPNQDQQQPSTETPANPDQGSSNEGSGSTSVSPSTGESQQPSTGEITDSDQSSTEKESPDGVVKNDNSVTVNDTNKSESQETSKSANVSETVDNTNQ